jgi:hypothetical protein
MEWGDSADHSLEEMIPVTLMLAALAAAAASHAPAVVIAALHTGPDCFSTISATNLSGRALAAEIQARIETGALLPLELVVQPGATEPRSEPRRAPRRVPRGQARDDAAAVYAEPSLAPFAGSLTFAPHERKSFRLGGLQEAVGDAWVGVWEDDPAGARPALEVEGYVECIAGDQLRTVPRRAALAMRNPWFAEEVSDNDGAMVAVVNASAQAALADLCYSAGNLYFVPAEMPDGRLAPLCSWSERVLIPPFGSREFPVSREGATAFALHTRGDSIVLLLLRPVAAGVREYHVDSSVHFGSEVPPGHPEK